jgi:anti-sigma-K factor RskA
MSAADHARFSENVAAYALGALEPAEAAELERHLEGCERCRAELRWLEPAVRSLSESVPRLQPPPGLRQRLIDEVRDDAARSAPSAEERPRRRSSGWARQRGPGSLGWRPVAAFAAVALVVAAIAGYEVGSGGSGGGAASTVTAGKAPGVTARMVRKGEGGTLHLANVRQLPEGRVLEAWVRRNGEIEPVPALFVPNRAGRASTMIADMGGVDTVMVTAEPSGGTKAPTSTPIVTMPIPQ